MEMAEKEKRDRPLTVKQQAFAEAYVLNGGDASAAYRAAYDASKMKDTGIWVNASKLLKNTKVALRISEIRAASHTAVVATVDALTVHHFRLSAKAEADGKYSAAGQQLVAIAKLHGLITDKTENTHSHEDRLEEMERRRAEAEAIAAKQAGVQC